MVLEYIKQFYGLEFNEGDRVNTSEGDGTIVGGDNYVWVKLDKYPIVKSYFHPTDVHIISKERSKCCSKNI
jgi:hypothetical protein